MANIGKKYPYYGYRRELMSHNINKQNSQVNQEQQLFMNPQAENLQQMYNLVGTLMEQLDENKKQKAKILQKIDTLSDSLNRDPDKRRELYQKDMVIFEKFLDRENSSHTAKHDMRMPCTLDRKIDGSEMNSFQKFKQQNEQLKNILEAERFSTFENFEKLKIHEEGFHRIVISLRQDIENYRSSVLNIVTRNFNNVIVPREDLEFEIYMDNIDNFDKLIEVANVYRALLKLLND